MSGSAVYTPILRAKEGEIAAIEALGDDLRASIAPMLEVPRPAFDYQNGRPSRTLNAYLPDIVRRCASSIASCPSVYLDLGWNDDDTMMSQAAEVLYSALREQPEAARRVVPVVRLSRPDGFLGAAGQHAREFGTGMCVRLLRQDLDDDIDPGEEVQRVLASTGGASIEGVDLVIDLGDIADGSGAVLMARAAFQMCQPLWTCRRFVLAAASFPVDLSELDADGITTLTRAEWDLWKALQRRPNLLPRTDLAYGDYGISNPVTKEIDPRTMRMSASIRYTTADRWLVLKGRNVRQFGFEQYYDLSKQLVQRDEYSGAAFSWGDAFIDRCARGESGTGNATTWRKVGTNHHIAVVVSSLANPSVT